MAIKIAKDVVRDDQGRVRFRRHGEAGDELYNLKIYLDGPPHELDNVKEVEYVLHPTFPDPRQVVADRSRNFALEIWTWGMFNIEVTIRYQDGSEEHRDFYLSYKLPADNGRNYAEV